MKQISNNKGFSYIFLVILILILLGVSGYFVFNYFKTPSVITLPITKFEDPKKRFTFEYKNEYNFSDSNREISTSSPLKLTRNVTLKTGENSIYQIKISLDTNKTNKSPTDLKYIKEFDNYSLIIEAEINVLDSEQNYIFNFPLPDENLNEIKNDLDIVVKNINVSKNLYNLVDLSKAKKVDKLVDGYLLFINEIKFGNQNSEIYNEPLSYLVIVPSLDEKVTQENISVLVSSKNPNRFGFTIYGNDIYYIQTLNPSSKPDGYSYGIPPFSEQEIYKFSLNDMKNTKLINNKLNNIKDPSDNQYIRGLYFNQNKMYFIANSILFENDLTTGKTKELKKLTKKQGANLGIPGAFAVNTIDKIENNKIYMFYDTCPFIANLQGGCNPGGFQQTFNLSTEELKEEEFDRTYQNSCNVVKIENGKINVKTYNDYNNDECQKINKIFDNLTPSSLYLQR
jgi:hypothetical protein